LYLGKQIKSDLKRLSIADDVEKILQKYPFLEHEKSLVGVEFNEIKDFFYHGDEMLTQYVLSNLIGNALYAIRDAERGKIKISLDVGVNCNVLRFTDTALGISKKELPGIFERVMSKKQDEVGFGLAFCKMVMQIYGGDISCKSKFGEYTEFTLSFPKVK